MLTNDCMPAEFEKQSAILLGCNELLPYHPRVLVELAAALIDKIALIGLVEDEEQRNENDARNGESRTDDEGDGHIRTAAPE